MNRFIKIYRKILNLRDISQISSRKESIVFFQRGKKVLTLSISTEHIEIIYNKICDFIDNENLNFLDIDKEISKSFIESEELNHFTP